MSVETHQRVQTMTIKTVRKNAAPKIFKLRGTLVAVDLVNHTVTIQPSEHDAKKVRRLAVMPASRILAGDEHKTLADVMVGDWVHAHFVKEGDHAVLTSLHIPRAMTLCEPLQQEAPACPAPRVQEPSAGSHS